jgi:CHAT domain-containing protein
VKSFANALLNSTQTHLHDLYKLLVEPIRGLLAGSHLAIVPHGILHNLPFHALFDGRQYLIDEFTVSYAPSASVYSLCKARSAPAYGGSLVLGIPDPSVPFVHEEVEAVAACLPNSEVLFGQNATVQRLREKGPYSRFIHMATHGYFRRDNPMFSGIRLGDSYLSLYDLCQLKLPAELVALSGCSTGLNVVAAGDELIGLARGLIQAGAETSMLTLWDAQDQSAAQLMKFFYSHVANGRTKSVALQQAMRQVKSELPHPYYWGPFILMGKG